MTSLIVHIISVLFCGKSYVAKIVYPASGWQATSSSRTMTGPNVRRALLYAWTRFRSRKNSMPEKCLELPQNPQRPVHHIMVAGHHFFERSLIRVLRTRCVRPVRPKLSERIGAGRRKSLDFRNCISMQVMILRKRYLINPCLPGERETAPSLGVRLVNAGRKREEKPEKSNRMTGLAGKATMDKTTEDALRCRNSQLAKAG